MNLTKTEFVRGVDCFRRLWLDRNRPDLVQPLTPPIRERMEVGGTIGRLAHSRYPHGVLIPSTRGNHQEAVRLTQEAIESGQTCIFEATFLVDSLLVRVDVLWRGEDGWVLDEVKSSTVKEPDDIPIEKLLDLAFQYVTLRKAGLNVVRARLVLVDSSYVWPGGDFDSALMMGVVDVTERCEKLQTQILQRSEMLLHALAGETEPEVEINTHCKKCDYFDHCLTDRPYDVIHLPRINADAVRKIRKDGFHSIPEIPDTYKMTDARKRFRAVVVSGSPDIGEGLSADLEQIRYPALYIDYETSNPAFPAYPGTRPYQQICFQWSAHLVEAPGLAPLHFEYLAADGLDPRPEFCRSLWELVERSHSIVYYTGFELNQLRAMERDGIPFASELVLALEARRVDLEKIVREHVCFREFMGRTSLKVVLPVLVPSLSYREMRIGDGVAAAWGFRRMLATEDVDERAALRQALLDYCRQDTLAMVEIHRALVGLTPKA